MENNEQNEVKVKKNKKLKTKDLIYAGAFAALYIVAMFIVVMVFGFVPILYLMAPIFVGIVCATIYLMYISKVQKFGAILILGILFGLIMSMSGHALTIVIVLPIVIAAEFIAKAGKYQSKKLLSASYMVFNMTMVAPFYNLYFASEMFIEECIEFYGAEYGATISNAIETFGYGLIGLQLVLAVVGALIGVILARVLFKKHFEKAGLI